MASSTENQQNTLSDIVSHLEGESRLRYIEKLNSLGGINDPYTLPASLFTDVVQCDSTSVPDFAYHDLYNYIVFNPSPYTGADMKAYKSLEAYKYFLAGWVNNLQLSAVNGRDFCLVQSKVGYPWPWPMSWHGMASMTMGHWKMAFQTTLG